MNRRIAIVSGIPAPYREPVFANLAARPGITLNVFYCSTGHSAVAWSSRETRVGESDTPSRYDHEFLPNWAPKRSRRLPMVGSINPAILTRLRRFDPDYVVIHGYDRLTHWLAIAYCRSMGIPIALRGDSNARLDTGVGWRPAVRRVMLRWLVRRCSAVLSIGSANRDYWRCYGATERQIHSAPYAVDNAGVARAAGDHRPDPDGRLRFLYVGRLVRRKRVDLLIAAFERLHEQRAASLTILGDGPEADRLRSMQSPSAAARTRWLGKLSNEQAWGAYGRADLLVLPSKYEPWGLVVNEAMAAGLPVIADHRCGAALDLIDEGRTGWRLRPLDEEALLTAMRQACDEPARVCEMGRIAQRHIQRWSFDRTVDGFLSAIDAAPSVRPFAPVLRRSSLPGASV